MIKWQSEKGKTMYKRKRNKVVTDGDIDDNDEASRAMPAAAAIVPVNQNAITKTCFLNCTKKFKCLIKKEKEWKTRERNATKCVGLKKVIKDERVEKRESEDTNG